jgi:hypothetical protein
MAEDERPRRPGQAGRTTPVPGSTPSGEAGGTGAPAAPPSDEVSDEDLEKVSGAGTAPLPPGKG